MVRDLLRTTSLVILTAVLYPITGAAQLTDCASTSTGFKVFLDDIIVASTTTPTPAQMILFRERLRTMLSGNLRQLQTEMRTQLLRFSVVPCDGRRPKETDFAPSIVAALNERDVLLEVWGITGPAKDQSGRTYQEASISYALIPVLNYERTSGDLTGVLTIEHQSQPEVTDSWNVFEGAQEVQALVTINLGIKFLKSRKYDFAKSCFCRTEGLLVEAGASDISSPNNAILNYVKTLSAKTVDLAKKDATYMGALRLTGQNVALCTGGN